ncbi:MAG: NADH:ubiquinone reductase (Na(+)-transporting) subunit F [Nitrospinae bacterium]|nr:NADH:ubiquinone reductase (Na(+)-transporting) subunit F [Nitrospinota bacterium]
MSLTNILFLSSGIFTLSILAMVGLLLVAQSKLVESGDVSLRINDDDDLTKVVPAGSTLLTTLSGAEIFLPSACGGGGTCGMCKCQVVAGGGDILPTETSHIGRNEAKEHWRLSCQVKVKQDMSLLIPDEIFNIKKFECTVRSNRNVASFIKELILELDNGETLKFKSGGYIQIDIPPYDISFKDFAIEEEYCPAWNNFKLWEIKGKNEEPIYRAYSMANHPAEGNIVMLNVRIATPPPGATDIPPGLSSTYIFNLKPGDKVTVSGPYGEFFVKPTKREMCFIGGGAGMAPMRSHIYNQMLTEKTDRKVTFWYGARSRLEMFYHEEYLEIAKNHPNFSYNIALSDPQPEDKWDGPTGFIHNVIHDMYLKDHEDPTEIEYYLCGPPMMMSAVQKMLYDLGVEKEMIAFDEF